jgi:hypothetical protein
MSAFTTVTSRIAAAASALALSVLLFTNTVTLPQHNLAATTFVGELA